MLQLSTKARLLIHKPAELFLCYIPNFSNSYSDIVHSDIRQRHKKAGGIFYLMQFSDTKLAEGNFCLGTTSHISKSQVKEITVLEKEWNFGFINLNEPNKNYQISISLEIY